MEFDLIQLVLRRWITLFTMFSMVMLGGLNHSKGRRNGYFRAST